MSCPILFSAQDFGKAGEGSQARSLQKGEFLFMAGDRVDSLFLIESGRLRVFRLNPDGRELYLDDAGPGEIVGELELMTVGLREQYAQALEEAVLREVKSAEFMALLEEDPSLRLKFIRLMLDRQGAAEKKLLACCLRGDVRIARFLLAGKSWGEDHNAHLGRPFPGMTQSEIAKFTGLSRESVNKILASFRRRRLIRIRPRSIVICNNGHIQKIAQGRAFLRVIPEKELRKGKGVIARRSSKGPVLLKSRDLAHQRAHFPRFSHPP